MLLKRKFDWNRLDDPVVAGAAAHIRPGLFRHIADRAAELKDIDLAMRGGCGGYAFGHRTDQVIG